MKKILIALLLLGAICANSFAQEYDVVNAGEEVDFKHSEAYLAAGFPSFVGIWSGLFVAIFEGLADAASGNSSGSSESTKSEPAFTLAGGYNYYFTENFGLGGFISYEKFSSLSILSIQAKVTAQYGWEHIKFYHSASGGICFIPGGDKPSGAFDITVLGIKFDFDNFNIFIDANFPMTGLLKAGASFKF